jgi:murein DD-endopeptidase MepM/ murein hydrolase activator NlpD
VGTPFYAAGNGTVKKVVSGCRSGDRYCGNGYGNYILLQHSNSYSTEYAHLLRPAKNIRVGTRVSQGDIIGFVGTTGLSSGPHLHYGIIRNGIRINPSTATTEAVSKLSGKNLTDFLQERNRINNFRLNFPNSVSKNN